MSRMKNLVSDLLDFSRIGVNSPLEEVNLNHLVEDVISDLKLTIDETKTTVNVDSLPMIKGHKTELRLLFQNLISNAIKFRRLDVANKVEIKLTEDRKRYTISIVDNGIGIEERQWERIFEVFFRVHSNSKYDGTGIGLAHCKRILNIHQGEIWVESNLGKGSSFNFSIPKR